MTGCPANPHPSTGRWALLAVLALIAASPAARAQDSVGRPLQLLPPASSDTGRPAGGRRSEITVVDELPAQDAAGAGILGPAEGGFGRTAWRGARRIEVATLLEGLPVSAPSPVMSDLSRRLLLTIARPPVGEPLDPSLAALRARRLLDLGRADDLVDLFGAGPALRQDEPAARALVESLLLAGRNAEACAELATLLPAHQGDFWQQALVFCQAMDGNTPAAQLGLGLLREGGANDPVFVALAEAVIEDIPALPPNDRWSLDRAPEPLMMAAFHSAGLPVPGTELIRDPGRLAAVARNEFNEVDARLAAGERATAAGAMGAEELAALYAGVPLDALSVVELLDLVWDMDGPLARAHLVQAANRVGRPETTYRLYDSALSISRADGASLAVILALLEPVEAAPGGEAIATDAARAYYAAGDLDRAWAWHAVAADAGERAALTRLWPLAVLSGALDAPSPAGARVAYARNLSEWIEAEVAVSGEAGTYSAAMALAAFSALGEPVDRDVWQRIGIDDARESASLPSAGIWWRLPSAAQDGDVGMVVLMSLVAIGDGGPARISPALLERVLSAMAATGLDQDARRLAREAIWATQL